MCVKAGLAQNAIAHASTGLGPPQRQQSSAGDLPLTAEGNRDGMTRSEPRSRWQIRLLSPLLQETVDSTWSDKPNMLRTIWK